MKHSKNAIRAALAGMSPSIIEDIHTMIDAYQEPEPVVEPWDVVPTLSQEHGNCLLGQGSLEGIYEAYVVKNYYLRGSAGTEEQMQARDRLRLAEAKIERWAAHLCSLKHLDSVYWHPRYQNLDDWFPVNVSLPHIPIRFCAPFDPNAKHNFDRIWLTDDIRQAWVTYFSGGVE